MFPHESGSDKALVAFAEVPHDGNRGKAQERFALAGCFEPECLCWSGMRAPGRTMGVTMDQRRRLMMASKSWPHCRVEAGAD